MITGVTGVLEAKGPGWVQVRVGGGVTLQIFAPSSTVEDLGIQGEEVHLHTRLYIRDDEAVLYGFSTSEGLQLFQLLNTVSGIGPRISLSLLSSLGPGSLIAAVAAGDVDTLSGVTGVGKKGAGRLVVELKGKFSALEVPSTSGAANGQDGDVVSALMALGYSAAEVRQAVGKISGLNELSLEEKLRRALIQLGGG